MGWLDTLLFGKEPTASSAPGQTRSNPIVVGNTNRGVSYVSPTGKVSNNVSGTGLSSYSNNGAVLGADTGSGGGSGVFTGGPNTTTQASLADQAYQSRLQAIRDQLGVLQATADRQNGVAKSVRDEILGNIGTTYAGLQTAADTNKTNSLATLAENDRGVVRDYANNQGSLNASTEGAISKNRALARALGYGNSSFYQDAQTQARTSALDKTAANQNEQTSKLTAIKGKVADVGTWFGQKSTEIAQEKATLEGQAQREYQDQVSKNADLIRSGSIDSVDAGNQALTEYQSKLDAISNYIGGQANKLSAVASAAGMQTSSINAYNPVNEIQPILSNNTGFNSAAGGVSSTIGGGGYTNSTSNGGRAIAQTPNQSVLDQYLYPKPLYA